MLIRHTEKEGQIEFNALWEFSDNLLTKLYHKSAKTCALKMSFKLLSLSLSRLEPSLDPVANEAFYEHMREERRRKKQSEELSWMIEWERKTQRQKRKVKDHKEK